jgi:Protein of unknown function (DUF3102)
VIETGKRLSECRTLLKEEGKWRAWLKAEFDWTERSSRNFINFHEWSQSDAQRIAHSNLPLRSLHLLAAPTPAAVRDEVLQCATRSVCASPSAILPRAGRFINLTEFGNVSNKPLRVTLRLPKRGENARLNAYILHDPTATHVWMIGHDRPSSC